MLEEQLSRKADEAQRRAREAARAGEAPSTAIKKLTSHMKLIVLLRNALPVLIDSLPNANRQELGMLCYELALNAHELACDGDCDLLEELLLHVNTPLDDKRAFVQRIFDSMLKSVNE